MQMNYNQIHNITPKTIFKSKEAILEQTKVADAKKSTKKYYVEPENINPFSDPIVKTMSKTELEKLLKETQKAMEQAAKDLDFLTAARLRDEILAIKEQLGNTK
jgi:excinuclease ABC subunit B